MCPLRSTNTRTTPLNPQSDRLVECIGLEIRTPVDLMFDPPPIFKSGMEYFVDLQERLQCMHKLTRDTLGKARLKQHRVYDSRTRGQDFAVGKSVWVYCPVRKRDCCPN